MRNAASASSVWALGLASMLACHGPRQWAETLDATLPDGAGGTQVPTGGIGGIGGSAGAAGTGGTGGTTKDGATSPPRPDADVGADVQANPADAASLSDAPAFTGPCATGGRPCLENVMQVSAGAYHTCALLQSGAVSCWGMKLFGRLGNRTADLGATPSLVQGVQAAASVDAGNTHTCAVKTDGSILCWGGSALGNPNYASSAMPVPVVGLGMAIAVAAGRQSTCALERGGSIYCWGEGGAYSRTPSIEPRLPSATAVTASESYYDGPCALVTGGAVWCWNPPSGPARVGELSGMMAISAGIGHTCAIAGDRSVVCWGLNGVGQLGNGTSVYQTQPVKVVGLSEAVAISTGDKFTCAVIADGSVHCWGDNVLEELGVEGIGKSEVPVRVPGVSGAKAIASGNSHTCVVVSGGRVQCWGDNGEGQSGVGSAGGTTKPVMVVAQ